MLIEQFSRLLDNPYMAFPIYYLKWTDCIVSYINGNISVFQSSKKDVDLALTRAVHRRAISFHNDYFNPVDIYDFRFTSARPVEIQNYLMLVNPFDGYTWAFLLASTIIVAITILIIDTAYANWTKETNISKKNILYQSKHEYQDKFFHRIN